MKKKIFVGGADDRGSSDGRVTLQLANFRERFRRRNLIPGVDVEDPDIHRMEPAAAMLGKDVAVWQRRHVGRPGPGHAEASTILRNAVESRASKEEAIRRQLDRVLAGGGFARSERLSQFLRFLVERHLEARDSELKESVLAVEVFGRKAGYDPNSMRWWEPRRSVSGPGWKSATSRMAERIR